MLQCHQCFMPPVVTQINNGNYTTDLRLTQRLFTSSITSKLHKIYATNTILRKSLNEHNHLRRGAAVRGAWQ